MSRSFQAPANRGATQRVSGLTANSTQYYWEIVSIEETSAFGVVPYDAGWPSAFEAEASRLRDALGSVAMRIDHNGSTSIPGLAAKPIIDIQISVARLHPMPYIALMGLGLSALLAPVVLADRPALAHEWRRHWRTILVASAMNLTSYLLVLFAFRLSKVGYVVASRELSILFSAFIGSLWLREGRLAPRLAGASVVLAGVVCIAVARD